LIRTVARRHAPDPLTIRSIARAGILAHPEGRERAALGLFFVATPFKVL
jgi:hypothetical protein